MKEQPNRKQARVGTSIAVAATVTCVFIAAVVAVSLLLEGNANAGPVAAGSATDSMLARYMTGFVVVGFPALAALGISIHYRCINVTVRRILLCIVTLMAVWLCAACIITVEFGATDPPLVVVAVVSNLVIALFIESYIDARLFPAIHRAQALFRRLPFDLKILNDGGRVMYQTDAARPLDNTTLWRLAQQASPVSYDSAHSIHSDATPDVVFKPYRLSAGSALLTEDASEVNRSLKQLEERQDQLVAQNDFLMRNHAMQSLLYRQQRERELSEQVERDLASTAEQISDILDNRIADTGPEARAERLLQLNLVKVLVAYSKRKGMLALAAAESETMTGEQLALIARESMADLKSIGIECAVLVEADVPIAIAAVNETYDSFYDCVLSVLPEASPVIMTYITTRDGNVLEMRVVIECAIGLDDENAVEMIPRVATSTEPWTAVQLGIARNLEERLAARGGDYTIALDEGLVNVTVRARYTLNDQEDDPLQGGA